MATVERIVIADSEYLARPLTVRQIIDILQQQQQDIDAGGARVPDIIEELFDDGIDHRAFYASLQITAAEVAEIEDPEDLRRLMAAVAKANPLLAERERKRKLSMIDRLLELQRSLRASVAG